MATRQFVLHLIDILYSLVAAVESTEDVLMFIMQNNEAVLVHKQAIDWQSS